MPSPTQSKLWDGPTLVIDASTRCVQIGILAQATWLALVQDEGDALETLFQSLDRALKQSQQHLTDITDVAIGVGPGSILGLRLSLMALQTWRTLPDLASWRCHTFRGIELQARLLHAQTGEDFHLLSDFRGNSWHALEVKGGTLTPLRIIESEEIKTLKGPIHYSPTGRGRQQVPVDHYTQTDFSLRHLPALHPQDWAEPNTTPELYLPEPPVFKKWDAEPHRARI